MMMICKRYEWMMISTCMIYIKKKTMRRCDKLDIKEKCLLMSTQRWDYLCLNILKLNCYKYKPVLTSHVMIGHSFSPLIREHPHPSRPSHMTSLVFFLFFLKSIFFFLTVVKLQYPKSYVFSYNICKTGIYSISVRTNIRYVMGFE